MIRFGRTMMAALVLAVLACAEAGPSDLSDLKVHSVEVAPTGPVLLVGDTVHLTAYPKAADGTVLGSVAVEWSALSPQVAEVAGEGVRGVVRAMAPGTSVIRATSEGRTGSVTVTVGAPPPPPPAPVASVVVSPDTVTLDVGEEVRLHVAVLDGDGGELEGRPVLWWSADEESVAVDQTGLVTARAPQVVAVIAESEGVRGEAVVVVRDTASEPQEPEAPVASVTIEPAPKRFWVGQAWTYEAVARDSAGQPLEGRAVAWSVDDADAASIDPAGFFEARGAGYVEIAAEAEGVSASAMAWIFERPVGQVVLDYYGTFSDTTVGGVLTGIDTTWVDSLGVSHPATLLILHGQLALDWTEGVERYTLSLFTETLIAQGIHGKVVETSELTDRGSLVVYYDLFTGDQIYELTSSVTEGLTYLARFSLPGEVWIERPFGTIPTDRYFFHMQ